MALNLQFSAAVKEALVCTHNPLLIKSLQGILQDEGYAVEVTEQPSFVIQVAARKHYATIIIDSESFGLSVEEVIRIVGTLLPDASFLVIGNHPYNPGTFSIKTPVDLEEFKHVLHTMHRLRCTNKAVIN